MQGKRILLAAISGFILLSFGVSAFAVMSIPYGWYAEANIGSSRLSNVNYPGSSSSSGLGGSVNLGYKFMPYLAGELNYTQYANSSIKTSTGTKAGTDKHYSYGVVAKGIFPVGCSGFETFAKLGIGRLANSMSINNSAAAASIGLSSGSHTATGLITGVGAQYYFTPEMAVVGQWARIQGSSSTGNEELLSIGISYIVD